jgi:hypothetical protein
VESLIMNTRTRIARIASRPGEHVSATRSLLMAAAVASSALLALAMPRGLEAQWSTTYESFYLQAPHNWVFRNDYQAADRLFNAFDYGHAILYEKLWTRPNAPASELEETEYRKLTTRILVRPPRVPLEESAIEIKYAQLAPEAKVMFDWSHILHRQIYDVLADERLDQVAKDREVQRLIAYYKTRPDVAFSSKPKSMKLMQEQPFSLAFREKYPKFNGLIWGYHWLQVGLYEPLMVGKTAEARQAGVRATVARFWQMLEDPLVSLPYQMPMTAAVSPAFAERYPEAAIIFDNLHSMHDVVSDILANPSVPKSRKRAEILLAASRFRDDTSYVMPVTAWRTMSVEMGIENMGGPAVNFLAELPKPTVSRGAVMQHDDATGKMTGMKSGTATGAHAAMDHSAHSAVPARDAARPPVKDSTPVATDPHAAHRPAAAPATDPQMQMQMLMLMLHDSVIRSRVMADTAMKRMVMENLRTMTPEHRIMLEGMFRADSVAAARAPARPSASTKKSSATPASKTPGAKPAAKPVSKPAPKKDPKKDPMAGMDHSKMVKPPKRG